MTQQKPVHVSARIELLVLIIFLAVCAAFGDSPWLWLALVGAVIVGGITMARESFTVMPVDIWDAQERLMRASSQDLPSVPLITDTTLLYAALQMEEFSEQLTALHTAMMARGEENTKVESDVLMFIRGVAVTLDKLGTQLKESVALLRAEPGSGVWGMTRQQARDLMDGVTDMAVVTAGFGLSAGLPVRDAYRAVDVSNESKKNPDTGMIDKTPDGKWIKGVNYVKPDADLEALLDPYYHAIALRTAAGDRAE